MRAGGVCVAALSRPFRRRAISFLRLTLSASLRVGATTEWRLLSVKSGALRDVMSELLQIDEARQRYFAMMGRLR